MYRVTYSDYFFGLTNSLKPNKSTFIVINIKKSSQSSHLRLLNGKYFTLLLEK